MTVCLCSEGNVCYLSMALFKTQNISDGSNEKEKSDKKINKGDQSAQTYVNPIEVRDHLRLVWKNSKSFLKAVFGASLSSSCSDFNSSDMFFLDVVAVPPSRFRPVGIFYIILAEVPSVAWVLNGLSVDTVYPILLLYPPETPVPSLSFHNVLLGSLLCPPGIGFLLDSISKGLYSVKFDVIVAGYKWRKI